MPRSRGYTCGRGTAVLALGSARMQLAGVAQAFRSHVSTCPKCVYITHSRLVSTGPRSRQACVIMRTVESALCNLSILMNALFSLVRLLL